MSILSRQKLSHEWCQKPSTEINTQKYPKFRQIFLDRFKINYKLAVASCHDITAMILKLENKFVSTLRVLKQNVCLD